MIHQPGSSAPRKAKSVSTAKVLRERIKRNDDERLPRFLDCRKWRTTARPRKTLPAARNYDGATKKSARGRERGGVTPGKQNVRRGPATAAAHARARCFSARKNLATSARTWVLRSLRETQRIGKKPFRARAASAQSARQGGTEPGTTRFRDARRTTGPPAPRQGPAAPAAQPRPRGPDPESAQVERVAKFALLAPNLDLNNETDLEACGTRAELKRKSQESPLQAHPL